LENVPGSQSRLDGDDRNSRLTTWLRRATRLAVNFKKKGAAGFSAGAAGRHPLESEV